MEATCCSEGGPKDFLVRVVRDFVAGHEVEGGEHEDGHDEVIV